MHRILSMQRCCTPMKMTFSNGTRVELPNGLVVVLAVLSVALVVPVVAIVVGAVF